MVSVLTPWKGFGERHRVQFEKNVVRVIYLIIPNNRYFCHLDCNSKFNSYSESRWDLVSKEGAYCT